MGNYWIVVNIGCIECGVSSNIVGVFTSKDAAADVRERLPGGGAGYSN